MALVSRSHETKRTHEVGSKRQELWKHRLSVKETGHYSQVDGCSGSHWTPQAALYSKAASSF